MSPAAAGGGDGALLLPAAVPAAGSVLCINAPRGSGPAAATCSATCRCWLLAAGAAPASSACCCTLVLPAAVHCCCCTRAGKRCGITRCARCASSVVLPSGCCTSTALVLLNTSLHTPINPGTRRQLAETNHTHRQCIRPPAVVQANTCGETNHLVSGHNKSVITTSYMTCDCVRLSRTCCAVSLVLPDEQPDRHSRHGRSLPLHAHNIPMPAAQRQVSC